MFRRFLLSLFFGASLVYAAVSLTPSESAFAQKIGIDPETATPAQLAKARSMLNGRDPSSLSDEEIQMAKQAVAEAKMKGQLDAPPAASPNVDNTVNVVQGTTLAESEKQAVKDDRFPPPPKQGLNRYEVEFFAKSLPSAFYDLQTAVGPDYPIKPGDNLVLTLWGAVEREIRLVVNSQGKVNVEGVGLVSLNNLSLGEAQDLLRGRLKKAYAGLANGSVSMNLRPEAITATKVFVMGEVVQPGGYDMLGNSNVFLALYRAKGPTPIGTVRCIQITRASGEKDTIDLYDVLFKGGKPSKAILRDGDVVFLPRAEKLVAVDGDVGHPAIYELKGAEDLKTALALAGNPNPTAAHGMQLTRVMDEGRRDVLDLDPPEAYQKGKPYPLRDGDSLIVREATEQGRNHIDVEGAVWFPGRYELKAGSTTAEAIAQAGGLRPEAKQGRLLIRRTLPDSTITYLSAPTDSGKSSVLLQEQDLVQVLSASQLRSQDTVSIAGGVKNPQRLLWQKGMSAQSLIALAGGFVPNRLKGKIRIEHLVPGKREVEVEEFTIRDDLTLGADEIPLRPGDRVVVPLDPEFYQQEVVTLSGAFLSPGPYSLLHKRETFRELMTRVGQLDPNAYLEGGRLYRRRGDDRYQINFSMADALGKGLASPIALQDGDVIEMPFEQLTVRVKGEVVSPGDVLWVKGMDIEDYVDAAGGLTRTGDEERVMVTYANGKKATIKRAELDPDPGAEIYVPFKKDEPTDWYKVWGTVAAVVGAMAQTAIALIVAIQ
jgi:protein involved in polysaccharide export with SLBB domain